MFYPQVTQKIATVVVEEVEEKEEGAVGEEGEARSNNNSTIPVVS